jgi:uncharacterized membrane protein
VLLVNCWQAESLLRVAFGLTAPESFRGYLTAVPTTSRGWILIILGNAIGFILAGVALSIHASALQQVGYQINTSPDAVTDLMFDRSGFLVPR